MPRRATLVSYHGKTLPICTFAALHGVCLRTAKRWLAEGCFTDAHVDAYLAKRAERREALELAKARGIKSSTVHMRRVRGLSMRRACTAPVRGYERRATREETAA